jgi:4-coumarate--CoA ligase
MTDWLKAEHSRRRRETLWDEVDPDGPFEGPPWRWDSLDLLEAAGRTADRFSLRPTGDEDRLLMERTPRAWARVVERAWGQQDDPELSFSSTGTTGEPQVSRHRFSSLREEVGFFASVLPRPARIWTHVPAHHIYGFLFTAVLPDLWALPVAPTRGWSRMAPGDLVVTFPWAVAQGRAEGASVPPGVTVVSSAGALTSADWEWLGSTPTYEIFGSSETSGLGFRTSGETAFRWLPGWTWKPGESQASKGGRTYPLPDDLEPAPGPGFRPLGRRDRQVKVGGHLVSLDRVREALVGCPGVRDAAVRLADEGGGPRLRAFVVLGSGTVDQVWDWIAAHLSPAERPQSLVTGPALPPKVPGQKPSW